MPLYRYASTSAQDNASDISHLLACGYDKGQGQDVRIKLKRKCGRGYEAPPAYAAHRGCAWVGENHVLEAAHQLPKSCMQRMCMQTLQHASQAWSQHTMMIIKHPNSILHMTRWLWNPVLQLD